MFKEINYELYKKLKLDKYYKIDNNPYFKCIGVLERQYKGYIFYSIIYDRVEIDYIYVLEVYRHLGIGEKLINYVIKEAMSSNFKNISLEVDSKNDNAIGLYKKCNFKEVAIRKNYYNGSDGILMVRNIGD